MCMYAFVQLCIASHIYIKPPVILSSLQIMSGGEWVVVENFMMEMKPFRKINTSFWCKSDDFCIFVDFTTINTFSNQVGKTKCGLGRGGWDEDVWNSRAVVRWRLDGLGMEMGLKIALCVGTVWCFTTRHFASGIETAEILTPPFPVVSYYHVRYTFMFRMQYNFHFARLSKSFIPNKKPSLPCSIWSAQKILRDLSTTWTRS